MDCKNITLDKINKISNKIQLFLIILAKDKLLYYDNNVFEIIKFLNELTTIDINRFKYIEICKIIYYIHFSNNLYDHNIYDLINESNANQLFNYIVYCNNNNIINDRIIELTEIFINSNKKKLLGKNGYYYFSYATILQNDYKDNNSDLFFKMIFLPKIEYIDFLKNFNSDDLPGQSNNYSYYNEIIILDLITDYYKRCMPAATFKILPTIANALLSIFGMIFAIFLPIYSMPLLSFGIPLVTSDTPLATYGMCLTSFNVFSKHWHAFTTYDTYLTICSMLVNSFLLPLSILSISLIIFGATFIIFGETLAISCEVVKNYNMQLNTFDISSNIYNKYNKFKIIENLINNEPNLANIMPLIANDILNCINKDIPIYVITEKIINKNDYNKKFDDFNFNNIYNEFIIKKTNINSRLYDLLLYIFYDKYILNYKTNDIFIDINFYGYTNNQYFYYRSVHDNLSHIYLSKYWDYIEKKMLQENILDTIEYNEFHNFIKIIYAKNKNLKKYLIENKLESSCIKYSNNLKTHYANCIYIQLKSNANIVFVYAYLIYINFINRNNSNYINFMVSKEINSKDYSYYHIDKNSNDNCNNKYRNAWYHKTCFIDKDIIDKDLAKNENDLYHKIKELKNIEIDKIFNKQFFIEYHKQMFEYKECGFENDNAHEQLEDFIKNNKYTFYDNNNLDIESEYFQNFIKDIVNIINTTYNCNMTIYNVKPKFIEIIHFYIMKYFDSIIGINNTNNTYIFKNIIIDITSNFTIPILSNKNVN